MRSSLQNKLNQYKRFMLKMKLRKWLKYRKRLKSNPRSMRLKFYSRTMRLRSNLRYLKLKLISIAAKKFKMMKCTRQKLMMNLRKMLNLTNLMK